MACMPQTCFACRKFALHLSSPSLADATRCNPSHVHLPTSTSPRAQVTVMRPNGLVADSGMIREGDVLSHVNGVDLLPGQLAPQPTLVLILALL